MTIFLVALVASLIALAVVIRLLLDVASDVAALPVAHEATDVLARSFGLGRSHRRRTRS